MTGPLRAKRSSLALAAFAACCAAFALACGPDYYEIPIETPIQPKMDVSPFQRVLVVPGMKNYFLASNAPLDIGIAKRIAQRQIRNVYVNQYYLDDAALKKVGFSRQKTAYARHLASAIVERRFRPAALDGLSDAKARAALIRLKGIGPWSADIYLLMALRRPDVWPKGDLALAVAAQGVKRLVSRPTPDELDDLAASWRPWRAVAARLLWHHYLSSRATGQRRRSDSS